MHLLVLAMFGKFCAGIARLLQYFNDIRDSFRNIYNSSNPSDCKKYKENMKFLGNFFFLILFIIKYHLYFYSGYLEV